MSPHQPLILHELKLFHIQCLSYNIRFKKTHVQTVQIVCQKNEFRTLSFWGDEINIWRIFILIMNTLSIKVIYLLIFVEKNKTENTRRTEKMEVQSGFGRFDNTTRDWWKSRNDFTKISSQTTESRWMEKISSFMGVHGWTNQSNRTPVHRWHYLYDLNIKLYYLH